MPNSVFSEPAFFFRLTEGLDVASFQEVNGLSVEIKPEGDKTEFSHRLPEKPKHQNLILKRGIMKAGGELAQWCKVCVESGLSTATKTKTLTLALIRGDDELKPLITWTFNEAWPVQWKVSDINAKSSEVATEMLEISYKTVERG